MLFKSIVSATLLASALAAPLQHAHHKHNAEKRAVVTKTNVVYVTVGEGAPAPVPTTAVPAPVKEEAAPAPVENAKAAVQVSASVSAAIAVTTSSSSSVAVATTPASSTQVAATSSSSAPVAVPSSSGDFNGGSKGVTYSPYADNGGCKSSSQISQEISELSGYEVIRLYGVDCNQVAAVLAAKTSSQKIFAGIFDVANIESGIESLASAVKSAGSWSDIHTVSIGNELVNNGEANPGQISSYIQAGKSALKAAGYSGPVVSVDTFIAVINNPSLCEYSDYIAVNAHAFFDGNVEASGSGDWVLQQIQRVSSACGGSKQVMITETGWPSRGDSNNKAVPSKDNQHAAISSIKSSCGNDVLLFTPYNDLWKADGPFNAEKYWGFLSN